MNGLCVWGDSIAKGVIYDEKRGRYAICRENCLGRLGREKGIEINNYSVMGQTSANGLARMLPENMKAGEYAVIEYGGNDCDLDWKAVSENPEIRQEGKVPLEQFGANIIEMVRRAIAAGMRPVLVTPPPLVAERYYEWVSRGLNAANILKYLGDVEAIFHWQAAYAGKINKIANDLGVLLVDIRSRMLEAANLGELMCIDGIHPNEKGHALIYDTVAGMLA